jgi:hypothetical protein
VIGGLSVDPRRRGVANRRALSFANASNVTSNSVALGMTLSTVHNSAAFRERRARERVMDTIAALRRL